MNVPTVQLWPTQMQHVSSMLEPLPLLLAAVHANDASAADAHADHWQPIQLTTFPTSTRAPFANNT